MTQATRPAFWLDDAAVRNLLDGTLDPAEEAELAGRVAALVSDHASLPNHTVATLGRVTHHLGGPGGVLAWLDRFPGAPRVTSRVTTVGDLCDRFSDDPDVVAALRVVRHTMSDSPGLAGHIVAATDDGTLANLAHDMELLAADGRLDEALRLARAAIELLDRAVPHLRPGGLASAVLTSAALDVLRGRLTEVSP